MAKPNKNVLKHKKFWLALIVIAVLIVGYLVYGQISTYSNKRDFQQARQTIDHIYQKINLEIGKPDNLKEDNSCSRSFQEFNGYVNTSCDVDTSFIFAVSGKDEAQSKINNIQNLINNEVVLKPTKPIDTTIRTTGVLTTNYYGAQNFYKLNSLDCTSKYVYNTPDDTFLELKHPGIPLYVVIGCTGPAKKLYYPLNQ